MADFQNHHNELVRANVRTVALSADPRDKARGTAELVGATYPIVFGLDALDVRDRIGCYINEKRDPPFTQSTSFLLNPDGEVVLANYSSGAVPRLLAEDVLAVVEQLDSR